MKTRGLDENWEIVEIRHGFAHRLKLPRVEVIEDAVLTLPRGPQATLNVIR
jgi:hypothetical protein